MTDRLTEIRERHAAATPGEWSCWWYGGEPSDDYDEPELLNGFRDDSDGYGVLSASSLAGDPVIRARMADAIFVQHAHEDIAYLLSEIERLWGLLADTGQPAVTPSGTVLDLGAAAEVWLKGES